MNIIDAKIVLVLNSHWEAIGQKSVKDALIAMCGGSGEEGSPPMLALNIEFSKEDPNELVFAEPLTFDKWIDLPVREGDLSINTSKRTIRVPTVLIAVNFSKVPKKVKRFTAQAIWERDGGVCQYTGKKLTKSTGNLDHVVPKSKGGKDTWTNVVLADKNINSKKGDKFNHEVGLNLIKQPKEPSPVLCFIPEEIRHKDWTPFIYTKKA